MNRRNFLKALGVGVAAVSANPAALLAQTRPACAPAAASELAPPAYFDLNDAETIYLWERELHAAVTRRSPIFETLPLRQEAA